MYAGGDTLLHNAGKKTTVLGLTASRSSVWFFPCEEGVALSIQDYKHQLNPSKKGGTCSSKTAGRVEKVAACEELLSTGV